jgi:hypothetical protein
MKFLNCVIVIVIADLLTLQFATNVIAQSIGPSPEKVACQIKCANNFTTDYNKCPLSAADDMARTICQQKALNDQAACTKVCNTPTTNTPTNTNTNTNTNR